MPQNCARFKPEGWRFLPPILGLLWNLKGL
jgi:hypothetical protein